LEGESNQETIEEVTVVEVLSAAQSAEPPDDLAPERVELIRISERNYLLRVVDGTGDVTSVEVPL
jgi:hypothetical protein